MEWGQPGGLRGPPAPAPTTLTSPLVLQASTSSSLVTSNVCRGEPASWSVLCTSCLWSSVGSVEVRAAGGRKWGPREKPNGQHPGPPLPSITGAAPCKLFCMLSFKLRFYLGKTFYNNKLENHQPSHRDVLYHKISPPSTMDLVFSS